MGQQRQSVEKLFGDALVMEPEARPGFLDVTCHDDPELKHLAEQLLMEDERAGSFFVIAKPCVGTRDTACVQSGPFHVEPAPAASLESS